MPDKDHSRFGEIRFPKPGLRMFKTVLAVFVCLLIVALTNPASNGFYAAIAAILCMQSDVQSSWPVARNRIIGTFIGGIYGLLVMLLLQRSDFSGPKSLYLSVIALSLFPLIYIMVLLRQHPAAYITCVVYLSLVLSTTSRDPLRFASLRMAETLLGILVSLGINAIPFLKRTEAADNSSGF